jgi:VWFA-related protein
LAPSQDQQPGVFRAYADVVFVEAAVVNGTVPVTGLKATDFRLLDNGVKQDIDDLSIDSLSIDVTLLIDVSGSVEAAMSQFAREAGRLAGALRASDRLSVATFATEVTVIRPLRPIDEAMTLGPLVATGGTSLYDAILWALARRTDFDRRQIVVVFTDGDDTASVVGLTALSAVASRSEGALHVVTRLPDRPQAGMLNDPVPGRIQELLAPLAGIARTTGGDIHYVEPRSFNLVNEFSRLLARVRQSYILRYRPKGVKRDGWHTLTVSVPDQKKLVVRARQGYFIG